MIGPLFGTKSIPYSRFVLNRGRIVGECNHEDIVFTHYRHKTHEVLLVALPRVLSCGKREMRERHILRVSFFDPPKETHLMNLHANNSTFSNHSLM